MTKDERDDVLNTLEKLYIKCIEIQSLMKDGKFIVAYEKIGGVIKILQQLGSRVEEVKTETESA